MNSKYLSFYTLSRLTCFREISHWECLKYHFRASRFQNFLGDDAPRLCYIKKLTSTARVFNPLPPASPSWNCASSACKSIDLRPMKWKYCKRNMVQVRLCSRSLVLILSMLVFSPPFSFTRFSAKREEWELRRDSYISLTKYDERVLLNVSSLFNG